MPKLPKLKVEWWYLGCCGEVATYDFEQTEQSLFSNPAIVLMVDGQRIDSYEELLKLAKQDEYKNKEFIEGTAIMHISGG